MLRTVALAKAIPKSFAIMPFIPSPNSLAPFFNPSKIVIKAIVNGVKKFGPAIPYKISETFIRFGRVFINHK